MPSVIHRLWTTRGGQPALIPLLFRERAGFQSNARFPPARSTGNLRVRGDVPLSAVAIPAGLPPAAARGRGQCEKVAPAYLSLLIP